MAPAALAHIFISYSRVDTLFVDRLDTALTGRGFELLIDRRDIHHFKDWWAEIELLISSSDIVAVVLSPDAVSSPYCLKEIEFAVSLGKRLAPIRYRPVPERDLPAALKPLQLFDFNQETFEPSTAALAAALADDIDWTRQHTQIAIAARRWEVKHRPTGLLLRSPALEEAERWLAARPRRSEEPASWTRDFVTDSRRQTTRRQRRTVVMSLTAATLAIAISGFAFLQMRAAERNFVAAKTAADGLVFDFVKSLRYQKGMSQGLIRTLLQTAEQVMDRIAPETDTSSSLLLTRFELLIEFHQTYWNSGDLARAHDYGLRALRTADQLLAQTGEAGRTPDARARLYRALMQTGDSLRNGGDLDAARGSFERARDLAQAQLDGGAARGD
ncbi:MAG: toll/interleukin-1 receptor domain-containing protein, partial [Bradyrhizobium sp.]|nr:toll/interleukin-1 receptor domain-containing protein [Bradyrhizobium sp.]